MILSDVSLYDIIINHGQMIVNPFSEEMLQPNSIELHLDDELLTVDGESINLKDEDYILKPHEFILGSTLEKVAIPLDLVAHVDGKSSLGRLGIFIHVSSGFIDSGFMGNITLEIYNCTNKEFKLSNGMTICQIIFETLTTQVKKPYGHPDHDNHYQNSEGVVLSKHDTD